MHRSLTAAVVAGLGVLTLTGASLAGDSANRQPAPGRTLTFDVRFSDFFLLDFGPTGVREVTSFQDPELSPSRGDQIVFEDTLLRHGTEVGAGGGTCTVTTVVAADPPILLSCQVTYQLPDGQVAAQGRASNAPVKTLAIVGGTGRYVGAGGELTLTENGDGTGTLVLALDRR
ncbi:allene oxide cyclase barrel-like domain-containing protein [Cellulomonas sp. ICMP 17802]|uniref:allene oxide cyclase barrel-like domain-containing protein n=1 Tax=Cellulomonas sp. ICMP 17802 TaxID=3239199 RepID=UPI00351BA153